MMMNHVLQTLLVTDNIAIFSQPPARQIPPRF